MEKSRRSSRKSRQPSRSLVSFAHYRRLKELLQELTSVVSNCQPDCSTCHDFMSKWSDHFRSSHASDTGSKEDHTTNTNGEPQGQGQKRSLRLRTRIPISYNKDSKQQHSDSERFIPQQHVEVKQEKDDDFSPGPTPDDNHSTGYQSEDEELDFATETEDLNDDGRKNPNTYVYECNICNKKFALPRSVYRHRRTIHKDTRLPCLVCQENFPDTESLNDHTLNVHPKPPAPSAPVKKRFTCSMCQTQFSRHYSLLKHERNIHKDSDRSRSYPCKSCPEKFPSRNDLRDHKLLTHGSKPTTRDFLCTECGKTFRFQYELTRHSLTHTYKPSPSGERTYKCAHPGCPSSFYSADHLRKHMKYHGDKPHACAICPMRFTVRKNLVCHMRTHTGERPFECAQCDKCFGTRSALNVHTKGHAGVKSHTCEDCGKGFVMKDQLIRHSRIHTGEKRYVCEECGRGFTQSAHLNAHRKGVHKNNKNGSHPKNSHGNQAVELEIESLVSFY